MSNSWSDYPAVDSDLVTGFGFLSTMPSPRFISLELERISFVMSWQKWELNKHTGNNIQKIYALVILIHINTTFRFVARSKSMADRLGVCKVCMCMRKNNTKLSAGSSRKNFSFSQFNTWKINKWGWWVLTTKKKKIERPNQIPRENFKLTHCNVRVYISY